MKLLCSDYDGTLHFTKEGKSYFKPEDLESVKNFRKQGNLFALCTGRVMDTIKEEVNKNIHLDYFIGSSGSIIFNSQYKDIFKQNADYKSLKEIFEKYHEQLSFYYHIDGHAYSIINNGDHYPEKTIVQSIDCLKDQNINGVSIHTPDNKTARRIRQELNNNYEPISVFQNNNWLDIVDKNISKGISSQKLKEITNADILCGIGDNYNDIELLKSADLAFCFDYSPEELKKEADYIVESVSEAIKIILQAE